MEFVGTMSEGEWSSFNGTSAEEADFMAQLLGNYSFSSQHYGIPNVGAPTTFWPIHQSSTTMNMGGSESSYYFSDTFISNEGHFPQGSNYSSESCFYFPTSGHEDYYLNESNPNLRTNHSTSMDYSMVGEQNTKTFSDDNVMEEAICTNEEMGNSSLGVSGGNKVESLILTGQKLQLKRKTEIPELSTPSGDKANSNFPENSKKNSRGLEVQKKLKNAPSKKKQKVASASIDEEETAVGLNGQSSCSYSSEDDSNASQEINGGTTSCSKGSGSLNRNGKARASRGSATDPQRLYARKRRERINERLRILQNLVPNGTKVDISTMLEEAVQYVKFMQLQIKLLSSDDMWMYAPIAYNGINIGLNLNIPQSQ